jgi:hypothetical protein
MRPFHPEAVTCSWELPGTARHLAQASHRYVVWSRGDLNSVMWTSMKDCVFMAVRSVFRDSQLQWINLKARFVFHLGHPLFE